MKNKETLKSGIIAAIAICVVILVSLLSIVNAYVYPRSEAVSLEKRIDKNEERFDPILNELKELNRKVGNLNGKLDTFIELRRK